MAKAKPRPKSETAPTRNPVAALNLETAISLACEGRHWDYIAQMAGYSSRGAAHNAVMRELQRRVSPKVDEMRWLMTAQCQELMQIQMSKAREGSDWASDRVLKIQERLARIWAVDLADKKTDTAAPTAEVVIRAYPQEWVAALHPTQPALDQQPAHDQLHDQEHAR